MVNVRAEIMFQNIVKISQNKTYIKSCVLKKKKKKKKLPLNA